MSIALDRGSRMPEIQPARYTPAATTAAAELSFLPNSSIFESPAERRAAPSDDDEINECSTSVSSSSSSSIGKNSDLSCDGHSDDENSDDDNEVQSSYKRTFDSMNSLEEALPMRRGISKFYNGKSKSYTSLAEASSSSTSIKDIAKAENAYTRKRRNLLAFSHIIDKNRSFPYRKRPISASKSTLALAVAMSSFESISSASEDSSWNSKSPPCLPPPYPRSRASVCNLGSYGSIDCGSSWRSYSVADLQRCGSPNN